MNRRKLLSLIGATALTPMMPPQVFASGATLMDLMEMIGYTAGDRGPEFIIPPSRGVVSVMIDHRAIIKYAD